MSATRLEVLQDIESAVWRELALAVQGPGHAWRVAVLATRDGQCADARSVVLRELDADARQLLIYTDARSPKLRQLAAHPSGTLVLWSAELGWQLRLSVSLEAETSGLRLSSRWALLKLTPAAQDYLSPLPPGSPLDAPAGATTPARDSREHFALITASVTAVDWLELHAQGHRRARFDASGAAWLTP